MAVSELVLASILGLVVGSFLNVVIYRLPRMVAKRYEPSSQDTDQHFNLAFPRSHCPHCTKQIAIWDNIPVLSYCWLRGQCRHCHHSIHWRYPLIELLTAILTTFVVFRFGIQPITAALLLLTWDLIAITAIDFEHLLIPDELSLPFVWLGLLVNLHHGITPLPDAVLGAVLGYLSLWTIYWLFKLCTGKEGMGYGDFKLTAVLGAWFGWQQLPLIIFLSAFIGLLFGGYAILIKKRSKETPFAFGPFIAIAGLVAMYFGNRWMFLLE